jgi:hypothetical protein
MYGVLNRFLPALENLTLDSDPPEVVHSLEFLPKASEVTFPLSVGPKVNILWRMKLLLFQPLCGDSG